MKLNLDKLSFMPTEMAAFILGLKRRSKDIYTEQPEEEDEHKKAIEPEHLKIISNLNFVVGYGRGYFAGALDEYTLVREKDSGNYYWFYLHFEDEEFKVYAAQKKEIDKMILNQDSKRIKAYLENIEENVPINYITFKEEEFIYNVWWHITRFNSELRQEFENYMERQREKYQENLLDELLETNHNIYLQDGNLYLKTATGLLFELLLVSKK
ncbi:hypothetical protein [Priestia aryabhattai]